MDEFLKGRKALVTGGSRGIGRAIAEALLQSGAQVALCGRNRDSVDRTVAELKKNATAGVTGSVCDVRNPESVHDMFANLDRELGTLDILVNNAGVGAFAPVGEMDARDWDRVIGTNLSGVFHCCREALPRMIQNGGGFIVQIGSLAGKNPFAGGAAYNASKFGLNGFAEAMMLDHRHDGIRVCNILPGSVNTEFSPRSKAADWKIAPEDIAAIVLSVLRMPERTLISHVEVRPSRPPKS